VAEKLNLINHAWKAKKQAKPLVKLLVVVVNHIHRMQWKKSRNPGGDTLNKTEDWGSRKNKKSSQNGRGPRKISQVENK